MNHGEFWFELDRVDQRFVFDTGATKDPEAIIKVLKASSKSGRSITVTFDLESGSFAESVDTPSFIVRFVEYRGRILPAMTGQRKRISPENPVGSSLARGVALYNGGLMMEAIPLLDKALSDEKLAPSLRGLALKTRGNAITDSIWVQRDHLLEDDEKEFVRAIADFRAWAALEPNNPDPQYAIGLLLSDLGAYEEAIETFQAIARRWPDEQFRPAIRIGATYRILGEYEKALAALDDMVSREGPQDGMMFHYHRGWTLTKLGRYAEAVTELSAGLKSQPDYDWALVMRACAYAQLGRPMDALRDQRVADAGLNAHWKDQPRTPNLEHDLAWSNDVVAKLGAAVAQESTLPTSAPCEGHWNYGELRRDRSPFLN